MSLSLLLAAALAVSAAPKDEPRKIEVGKPAPDVELPATSIYKVLPASETAAAHRIMQASEHFGKIILKFD